jgi:hypothetical protein
MTSETNTPAPVKRVQGKFAPGVSGNPLGRPQGTKNRITLLKESLELQLRERAAPNLAGVLDKAVELALDGDRSMIKLLLELHMAKGAAERENAVEKVEINISSERPAQVKPVNVIDVTPLKVKDK